MRTKPTLDKKAQAALNTALDTMLDELMVSGSWPDLRHYKQMRDLSTALAKHDPWRSHFAFFDLFETLTRFIGRYQVETDPDASVRLRDILAPDRFVNFSRDVH